MVKAGIHLKNKKFFEGNTLLIRADNFSSSNLKGLINLTLKIIKTYLKTMLTFKANKPSSCWEVLVD